MAHEYKIQYVAHLELPPAVVTADIPASWRATLSPRGGPSFAIDGLVGAPPAITAIRSDHPDPVARIEEAMALQYGAGTPGVTRTALPGGRVWAVRREAAVTHARMFVPAPGGVVMAVAIVVHAQADRLAELKAVFDTVRVGTP